MTMKWGIPGTAVRALVGLVLVLGGCGSSGAAPSASVARPDGGRATEASRPEPKDLHSETAQGGSSGLAAQTDGAVEGAAETGIPGSRPTPLAMPFESKVPVEATVTPVCVHPGQTVTIEVLTKPEAAVAYSAVYAGNQSGAEPPFGHGYGGNDKGYASKKKGRYESTWIVRIDAPRGPARVDVVVGYRGRFGYDDPPFAVADQHGNCPQAWLGSGDETN